MMKLLMPLVLFLPLAACRLQSQQVQQLEAKIDSLRHRATAGYRPGLGEFMSAMQLHHAKLWFAGKNQNWPLADFELQEIRETIDGIRTFNTDRPEIRSIGTIMPALDSMGRAISAENLPLFETGFQGLTNACNSCHRETGHGFNVITIPVAPPVVNQDFRPHPH